METDVGEVLVFSATIDRDIRGCGGPRLDAARSEVLAITDDHALRSGWQRVTGAVVEYSRPVGDRHLHRTTAAYEPVG